MAPHDRTEIKRNTIARQHTVRLLLALAAGVLVFFVMYYATGYFADQHLDRSGYYASHDQKYVQSLQEYVRQEHVSVEDADALTAWGEQQENIFFQVYAGDQLVYQYYSRDARSFREAAGMDFLEWISSYPVKFINGTFQVIVFGDYYYKPFRFMMIVNVAVAFAVFLLIFLTGIRKRTRYIMQLRDEIEILGGGDLDYEITVQGNDELTDLAENLDQMRQALRHHMEEETRLTEERQNIVTQLSHDIRTPLTSMNLFADLVKRGNYRDETERDHYLDRIQENAANLTELAEELFQASRSSEQITADKGNAKAGKAAQISGTASSAPAGIAAPITCDDASAVQIGEGMPVDEVIRSLADAAEALRLSGFLAEENYAGADSSGQMITMDRPAFARVLDNITSNILRYADPARPVRISCETHDNTADFAFENTVSPPEDIAAGGSGIGLQNVRSLVEQAGGTVRTQEDDSVYRIELHCRTAMYGKQI